MTSSISGKSFTRASTIDEVLDQLNIIIEQSIKANDRNGYFASLYYKMTMQVKEGISRGDFEDPTRMELLDVCFANRYLEAHFKNYHTKEVTGASWNAAFGAARKKKYILLQQLLLGINAHINFDLGIATVEAAKNDTLMHIRKDFTAINTMIGSLIFEVVNDVNRVSPLFSLLGIHGSRNDSILIQFSINNARDGAWCFAEELSLCNDENIADCINKRDLQIADLSRSLLTQRGLMNITLWLIHLFEWRSPKKIIELLHNSKKKFFKIGNN